MAFKPIDPKRDEFRRYLERAGVVESLSKVFVRMYNERPEQPLEYMRGHLGDAQHQADNLVYLRNELDETRREVIRLRDMIMKINPKALEEAPETPPNTPKESSAEKKFDLMEKLVKVNNPDSIAEKEALSASVGAKPKAQITATATTSAAIRATAPTAVNPATSAAAKSTVLITKAPATSTTATASPEHHVSAVEPPKKAATPPNATEMIEKNDKTETNPSVVVQKPEENGEK